MVRETGKKIVSVVLCILLIAMIFSVLIPPATSVYLSTGSSEDTIVCNESSITFTNVNLTIRGEERIPINFLNFSIYDHTTEDSVAYIRFSVDGVELSDFPSGKLTVTKTTTIPSEWYNYGYGYGYDEQAGGEYYFGYGYSYGYGDASLSDITILYDITYTTHQVGTFHTKLLVNSSSASAQHSYISSPSTTFQVRSVPWNANNVSSTHAGEVNGSGTIDALDEANVTIDVTGTGSTVVMIANYSDNPASIGLSSFGYFFDAYVPDVTNATSITIKYWVTSTPTTNYQGLYYLNQTTMTWKKCSNTGYTADASKGLPYVGYNYATITSITEPRLIDLNALPFYSGEDEVTIALNSLSKTYYKSGDQLNISGYILPAINNEDIMIEVNDDSVHTVFANTTKTNSSGIFTDDTYLGYTTIDDGTVTIYAVISGTLAIITQSFTYDGTVPSATIDAISAYVNTAPSISGGSADAIALKYVYVRLNFTNVTDTYYWDFDNGLWTTTNTWKTISQTGTSNTWDLSSSDPVAANYTTNQLYTVSAYAEDQAGNIGTTVSDTYTYDTSAPTSTISTPSSSAKLNALLAISGTASDASGIGAVELQIINATTNYWNGTAWTESESWLSASGTTAWTYDSSSVTWSNSGENAAFNIKTRATDTPGNVGTPGSGTSWTYGITANVEPMETTYRGGAYHGARVNWTDVGMPTYKVYSSLSEITNVNAVGVSHVDTVSGTNTSGFSNLSSSMWGHDVYYAVTTVDVNGVEAPVTFIGTTNHTACWSYKMEIEAPTGITHTTSMLGWTIHYKNRLLSGAISPACIISEFLGPNATGEVSIPNRPVSLSRTTIPGGLSAFLQTGDCDTSGTYAGGVVGQNYKGWIMLWSRLPSQSGYWESYASVYTQSPITIT